MRIPDPRIRNPELGNRIREVNYSNYRSGIQDPNWIIFVAIEKSVFKGVEDHYILESIDLFSVFFWIFDSK